MADDFATRQRVPLCIDLDGTLIQTDLLHESLLLLVRHAPLTLPMIPLWLLRGRATVKQEAARRVPFVAARLPYRQDLLTYLRHEQTLGRRLILVTAADESIARKVQEHLQLFTEVIASDGSVNLKGREKARRLQERFGEKGFDYAGDSPADFAVWRIARRGVVVHDSERFIAKVKNVVPVEATFRKTGGKVSALFQSCRVYQWTKNVLVFVPVLTAHQLTNPRAMFAAATAFVAFSLVASGVYLFNDMLDLESDRSHPVKSRRALASGRVSIPLAIIVSLFLLLAGLGIGLIGGKNFPPRRGHLSRE